MGGKEKSVVTRYKIHVGCSAPRILEERSTFRNWYLTGEVVRTHSGVAVAGVVVADQERFLRNHARCMQKGRKLAAEAESLEKRGHEIQGRRNL
jgi:hypothetical protein